MQVGMVRVHLIGKNPGPERIGYVGKLELTDCTVNYELLQGGIRELPLLQRSGITHLQQVTASGQAQRDSNGGTDPNEDCHRVIS